MIQFLQDLFLRDFWLKLFSLALAILTWLTVSFAIQKEGSPVASFPIRHPKEQTYYNIPVKVVWSAADVRSFKVNPTVIQLTVRGEASIVDALQSSEVRALVDLTGIESGGLHKRIDVTVPGGITISQIVPDEVEVIVSKR